MNDETVLERTIRQAEQIIKNEREKQYIAKKEFEARIEGMNAILTLLESERRQEEREKAKAIANDADDFSPI